MTDWIVIKQDIVTGGDGREYTESYWDGRRYDTKANASGAGFRQSRCDDFCLGQLEGDRLIWFGWMGNERRADLPDVARQLYLEIGDK